MTLLSFRMRWIQLLIYKIHTRDDEKLCFAEKTKIIILQKSGGAMAPLATLAPPVSMALQIPLLVWRYLTNTLPVSARIYVFFLSGLSFTDTDNSQVNRGREVTIAYSTLPLPPAHKYSYIYLQLCMWDDYHMFLIATPGFTRLLLDEINYLIELPFDWLMM